MISPDVTEDWLDRERLHRAAEEGDLASVQQLLAERHPVSAFDDLGKTPLHYAAQAGRLEIMKLLIAAGADVNAHDERVIGETPLGEVAGNCTYEVAKVLIEAGADPTIPGWMRLSALDRARQRKRPEGVRVAQLLEQAARNPVGLRKERSDRERCCPRTKKSKR